MTRRSRREIERALEDLSGGGNATSDESFAEKHYSDSVTSFVHRTIRDVLRLKYDSEVANSTEPARALLVTVRERYGIDEKRDEAVLSTLQKRAQRAESRYWMPTDAFGAAIVAGPAILGDDRRARFDSALEAGEDDVAAVLIVQAVYDWLADSEGTLSVEVPV